MSSKLFPTTETLNAVEIRGLRKVYGETVAVDGIDLTIPRGVIFAVLGPNGAGKTTTIHSMVGLCRKSGGTIKVFEHDVDHELLQAKARIGFVPQEMVLDNFLTVEQLLKVQSGYYGIVDNKSRIEEILERLALSEHRKKRMPQLSGGEKRRVLVAKALVHDPDLLILDEPTAGVDVHLRQSLWRYVQQINQQGTTILLTTHYIEEAERLADRVAIMHKGRIVAEDSPEGLLQSFSEKTFTFFLSQPLEGIPEALSEAGFVLSNGNRLTVRVASSKRIPEVIQLLQDEGIPFYDLHIQQQDLEDVFFLLTKS